MSERDKFLPDPTRYTPMIHEADYDAPHDGLTPQQREYLKRRSSRTVWAASGAGLVIVLGVGGLVGYDALHQEKRDDQTAEAPITPAETSVISSPSAPESASESPSPSPSKTSASPSPSKVSPSALPSDTPSATFSVSLPPETTPSAPSAPETTPSQPGCAWEVSGGNVTVGECGDHTAYNDENRTGAHQLPVGMMFGNVCMKGGMVAIHYGDGYDLVDNHGYFPIPGNC